MAKQRIRKVFVWVILAVVVLGLLGSYVSRKLRNRVSITREDYRWEAENFPKMDALYEAGDYEGLLAFYDDALMNDHMTWRWQHSEFCSMLVFIRESRVDQQKWDEKGELTKTGYISLLFSQCKVKGIPLSPSYTEEEKEVLQQMSADVMADFDTRWQFTDEELAQIDQEIRENPGYLSYEAAGQIIEIWLKRQ